MPKQPNSKRYADLKKRTARAVIANRKMEPPRPPKKAQPGKGGGGRIIDSKPFSSEGAILESIYRVMGVVEGDISTILVAEDDGRLLGIKDIEIERRIGIDVWAVMTDPEFLSDARAHLTINA